MSFERTTQQNIPIFVINLKQDTHKKKHMQEMAEQYGFEFSFIEAIYGKELAQDNVDEICRHEESLKAINRKLFRGEVGVALSQMSIYQKMLDENIQDAIIFEDDVIINENLFEVINAIDKFPQDWEIVLLGYHRHFISNKFNRLSFRNRKKVSENFKIVRFTDVMDGAFGYIINQEGAKKMLKTLKKGIEKPVDCYTGNSKYINLYGLHPTCVSVDITIGSSINKERHEHWLINDTEQKQITKKDGIKNFLKKCGVLSFLQSLNAIRGTFQSELKHLPKRLKTPKKYN